MEFVDREDDLEVDNIWVAVSNGDLNRVKEFIASGVSPNAQDEHGYSALHAAASYAQTEIIEYLVKEAQATVDILDNDGDSPLLFVEKPEVFELLVSLGADASIRNQQGEGIVEKVIEDENEEMVEYFITRGLIGDSSVIEKLRMHFANGGDMEEFNGEYNMDEDDDEEEEGDNANTDNNNNTENNNNEDQTMDEQQPEGN